MRRVNIVFQEIKDLSRGKIKSRRESVVQKCKRNI